MKWLRWRRDRAATAWQHADPARIAVLEHDLLGIRHRPGTAAAAAVGAAATARAITEAMARPVNRAVCPHDDVVDTTCLGSSRATGVCTVCGAPAVADDRGTWSFP